MYNAIIIMNDNSDRELNRLSENIALIIKLYQDEVGKNNKLTIENNEFKNKIEVLTNKNIKLEEKNKNLQLGNIILDKNKDAKLEIDKMIREINDCITLLKK